MKHIINSGELKQFRENFNLTQEDIANRFHLAPATVNRWENNRNKISRNHYYQLMDFIKSKNEKLYNQIKKRNGQ